MNYYNENDKNAAAWLRELIKARLIADGHVDERSILEVQSGDLKGFCQCHFFAGIGGWSYALRLAGWPDAKPVWTGSCPCQPFSSAGKRRGRRDPRHLWPQFGRLIGQSRPATVLGEQVASKDGRIWLAGVFSDLEKMGYSRAGADLCAAGVGAPHIRQRLYWVAHSHATGCGEQWRTEPISPQLSSSQYAGEDGRMAQPFQPGQCGRNQPGFGATRIKMVQQENRQDAANQSGDGSQNDGMANAIDARPVRARERLQGERGTAFRPAERGANDGMGDADTAGRVRTGPPQSEEWIGDSVSAWSIANLIEGWNEKKQCRELRRVKPGLPLLADGIPGRVAQLRGFGNAIVPQLAAQFIKAFEEVLIL